jgi:hypothetical protein
MSWFSETIKGCAVHRRVVQIIFRSIKKSSICIWFKPICIGLRDDLTIRLKRFLIWQHISEEEKEETKASETQEKDGGVVWTIVTVTHIQQPSIAYCMAVNSYNSIPNDFISLWQWVDINTIHCAACKTIGR